MPHLQGQLHQGAATRGLTFGLILWCHRLNNFWIRAHIFILHKAPQIMYSVLSTKHVTGKSEVGIVLACAHRALDILSAHLCSPGTWYLQEEYIFNSLLNLVSPGAS